MLLPPFKRSLRGFAGDPDGTPPAERSPQQPLRPRRWLAVAAAPLAASFFWVACSLTTSLDDLRGDGAVAADASVADQVETGADVVSDTEPPDAGPCEADLMTDPEHCGGCHHGCLGGGCEAGRCQPVVMVEGQNEPAGIAVHGSYVYWVNRQNPSLKRMSTSGGAQERLDVAADQLEAPFDVAVADGYVYWSERLDNEVLRKPLGGGAKAHVVWGLERCAYLTIADGTVFISDYREDQLSVGNIVASKDANGVLIYNGQPLAAGVYAQDGELFWGRAEPNGIMRGDYKGGPASMVVTASGQVGGLTYDGSYLYWIEDERRVMRADLGSASPQVVHEGSPSAEMVDLAQDAVSFWWTERATGRVARLAR